MVWTCLPIVIQLYYREGVTEEDRINYGGTTSSNGRASHCHCCCPLQMMMGNHHSKVICRSTPRRPSVTGISWSVRWTKLCLYLSWHIFAMFCGYYDTGYYWRATNWNEKYINADLFTPVRLSIDVFLIRRNLPVRFCVDVVIFDNMVWNLCTGVCISEDIWQPKAHFANSRLDYWKCVAKNIY